MARIILLHGASSSGKTTLARALQEQLPTPFWHFSLDHLRDGGVLPMARFRRGDLDWKAHRAAVFDGLHRMVAAAADAGNDLIFEHILEGDGWLDELQRLFAGHDVFFVGLFCDPSVLAQREEQRGDRPLGSAVRDAAQVHEGLRYDLELRSEDGVEANVARLLEAWQDPSRSVSEFSLRKAEH